MEDKFKLEKVRIAASSFLSFLINFITRQNYSTLNYLLCSHAKWGYFNALCGFFLSVYAGIRTHFFFILLALAGVRCLGYFVFFALHPPRI